MGQIERVDIRRSVLSPSSQLDRTAKRRSACRRKRHVPFVRGYVTLTSIDLIIDGN